MTTDSARIAIVTSEPPAQVDTLGPQPAWRVADNADGEVAPFLGVTDLAVTASGVVVVASNGSRSLVAFGPDGTERRRFGRAGEGPGEFRGSLSLATVGDTLVVWDSITRRMILVTPGGALARVVPVESSDPNLELAGSFADGTLFVTSRRLGSPTEGINPDSVVHLRFALDGTRLGEVGWSRFRNVEFFMGLFGPDIHDQAFGPTGAAASLGPGVVGTDGTAPQVVLHGADGSSARLLRWDNVPVPVTPADREAFAGDRRASVPNEFERMKVDEWLERATWSLSMPVSGLPRRTPTAGSSLQTTVPRTIPSVPDATSTPRVSGGEHWCFQ